VSAIELDQEARIPVMHFSSAVQGPDGKRFGLVVIDLDLRPAFAMIRAAAGSRRQVYVVNDEGDYLLHPEPAREFGFASGARFRWQDDFPDFADGLNSSDPVVRLVNDAAGNRVGAAMTLMQLADGPRIAVLETVPYADLVAPATAGWRSTLLVGLVALIIAVALAVIIAHSLTRPLAAMTAAVEGFARNGSVDVPVGAGGEIGVLARAFARMVAEVRANRAALVDSEAKFRALFANNPLAVWAFDRETLRIVEANEAALARYGYARSDIERLRIIDLMPPEDRPRSTLGQDSAARPARHFDGRHMLRDGTIINVEVTAHDMDLAGRPVTVAVINDITERERAQQALRESEQLARGIIDTALDAFLQLDERGRIVEWNAQAEVIFGWKRYEAVGQTFGDLLVPASIRQHYDAAFAQSVGNPASPVLGRRYETLLLRRDGSEVMVDLAATVLRRRAGSLFNAFIRDLTDKRVAEEQLRQAQKLDAVGKLTGGIAHDFNNILTVITGTIDILARAVAKDKTLASIAKMIDDAAERGAELTRRLLAFARKQPLQPRVTDINALVHDAATLLRPSLGEQVEIELMLEEDAWPALVDPNQLVTALVNLALNARDAMGDGGKVTLETGNVILDEAYAAANPDVQPGAHVMIAVSDTGSGIPAAIRDQVFEPFFTTKDVGKGTGLGLSMVYGFVKQSGGHVKIYSEDGHGTSVKIYLPRTSEASDRADDTPKVPALAGGREAILIAEDDELVRNYVVAQLRSLGYATQAVACSSEALNLIEQGHQFDLLFTDVIMPGGMNGRELGEEAVKRRPSLRVLYTSGYTDNAVMHHGRLDPGVALLNKPYRKTDLARKIREVLDG
jgi:PAS domain S-box-containing protein